MAELDDKLLKTLDQTLQNMNTHLQNLESTLRGVKGGIDATFNPAIIKSFSDGIRGLKAARIIDADKSVAEVNKIYSKIQDLSYMVKTGMKLEPMSIEQLEKYRQRLEEIEALLEPITGKKLKGQEWFDRRSLQRERDQIRDILDSESPVIPVPLKKEEIVAAVEELKKYKELYNSITKGEHQRAIELANIQQKEKNDLLKQEEQLNKEIADEEEKRNKEALQRYKEEKAYADDVEKRRHKTKERELNEAFGQQSKQRLEAEKRMNQAIQQQIQYYRQLHTLYKGYKDLQAKPNKTKEDIAILEQTKQKILEILRLSKQLELENKGSRQAGINATNFQRLSDNLRNATRETKTLKANLNNLLPTLQRLASAFGVAFSVRGLAQFGKKLIETRGEFEMQFVAMKQIIGDVDAATKIWNQTMQQALQSPFKAMQLVTYTKQLAAYRIETEKLFDTTKRLADISAGLGVDMGRLILAYGQVKSANFLRASEVRQFTEAGVNIVGNLAQYFSELENRAVSTADVMERITKRMVLFSDVEEIFKRMTDEGGTFYNMQEVQADTVKGQIAKLHDAYDQMLNTIGQANQGTLRDMIDQLNKMVRNWREVDLFLKENGIALAVIIPLYKSYKKGVELAAAETAYFTTTTTGASVGLGKLAVSERLATIATNTFRGAMFFAKTALKTFVPLLVIEGIVLLINKMTEAGREAKRLSQSLDEVGSKNAKSLQSNIDGFNELVEKLKQATEGSQEYYDIRNKIQSKYGEYLDSINAETISVENLANAYDRVIERMREKSRQHIMEEGLEEISKDYGKYFEEFVSDISKFEFSTGLRISRDEAQNIAKIARDLYEKNEKYRGLENTTPLFQAAFEQYGYDTKGLNFVQLQWKDFYKAIERSYEKQIELETKANSLTKATSDTHQEYLDQLALEEEHEKNIAKLRDDASIKSSGRLQLAIQAEQLRYEEKKLELQAQYQKKSDEWLKNEKDKLKENYGAFLNAYNEQVKAYIGGRFGEGWMQGDNSDAWKAYNFMIANQDRLSQGQTKWEEKILNDKKLTEENIQRIKEQQATQTAADSEAAKALNESLKQEEDRLELIKKQMELLGLHEKKKGGSGSANNSIYGERIRLLQDMLQKYKQLAKEAYGYAKAEGKVSESFEDAWNSIMPAGYGDLEVPTSYKALAEMLQRLEAFTPAFDKNGQLSKMLADLKKAVSDALSQVDIELSVRIRDDFGKQMEKAFSDYELTLELDKLNIPKDAIKDIFPDFDTETLGELQDRMNAFYESQRDKEGNVLFDEEDLKAYKQWSDKIDAEILKSRKEKAKQYSKYLEKEYSERAKLEMQHAKDVAFVTANISDEKQRDNIVANLNRKFQQDLNELNWKSFKESSFYVDMMDDLASLPKEYMQTMLNKIDEILKHPETLSPRALKEAINARQKILEAQMNLEPLDVMKSSIKTIRKAMDDVDGKTWKQTKEKINDQIKTTQEEIDKLEEEARKWDEVAAKMKVYEDAADDVETAKNKLSTATKELVDKQGIEATITQYQGEQNENQKLIEGFQKRQLEGEKLEPTEKDQLAALQTRNGFLGEQIAFLNEIIARERELQNIREEQHGSDAWARREEGYTSTDIGSWSQGLKDKSNKPKQRIQNLKQYLQAFKNFDDSFAKFNAAINSTLNAVQGMGNAFYDMFDALGGETDALTEGWKEFGNTMITQITQTLTMIPMMVAAFAAAGIAINSALGIIGLIAEALQLLFVAIGAIAKLNDARIDKEIEQSKERVNDLQKAYERLEKQIEKTFDTVSYMREFNKETQNLYEQIEEANRQIAAAQDYKSEDKRKEVIDAAEDAKQQALDALEEIKQAQIEVFGGIGKNNYRSAAEGFVDAWKSAFLETGDGLQGLQDHFDEFLNDWFVKQATMRIAASNLAPLFRKIDDAVDKHGHGDADVTWQELQEINDLKDLLLEQTNEQLAALASTFGLGGEGSLSGLAAGIQGMTEEQANILEAYWNDVRMNTASIDKNVAMIADILGAGGRNTNPQITYLESIASNTASIPRILELLSGMSVNDGNGRGFRSYMQ